MLGDCNAKIGRENILKSTNDKISLHSKTSDNALSLIDFAPLKTMVNNGTRFQHKDIHEATWVFPDQRTKNQIDHLATQGAPKEITLLEDDLILVNGRQCQICFDICGLNRCRLQVNKPWSDTLPKNAE